MTTSRSEPARMGWMESRITRKIGRAAAAAALLALTSPGVGGAVEGEVITLPSGREVILAEVVPPDAAMAGGSYHFRFIVPQLRQGEDWSEEMQMLCDREALPRIAQPALAGPGVSAAPEIVIALADRRVPFGESDPEAVQFFETYRLSGDACEWVMF